MAVKPWKPINLMDVIGMASNPVNPGTKYAKRLLNVHTHLKPGALTLRPGYAPKYNPPSESTITNSTFPNFAVFFDRQADPEGQEIILEIQKGIVTALKDTDELPIVANTMEGFWFWVRPNWSGSQWLNNWQWLNKTIITKITAVDATYLSHIKIFGNLTHGLGDDSLIGWTIYNQTKNQYAKIITCKLEDPNLWLNISFYNNGWEVDDIIIASRYWIDIDAQLEFYNNVEKEDIVFHRINNDIRIGFGGYENRPGLMIGYRKKYLQIKEVNFALIHPDIIEAGAIEKFAKTDGVILDTHILNNQYGIELTTQAGTLDAKTYYFRITGIVDDYEEQLIAEANIVTNGATDILVKPYIQAGYDNLRLTKIKIYLSQDGVTFYKIAEQIIRKDIYQQPILLLDGFGRFIPIGISVGGEGDYHKDSNAANITNESNSIGQWDNAGDTETSSLTSIPGEYPISGSYMLEWLITDTTKTMKIVSPSITNTKRRVNISFQLMSRYAGPTPPIFFPFKLRISSGIPPYPNPFGSPPEYKDIERANHSDWEEVNFDMEVYGSLIFELFFVTTQIQMIGIDALTITNIETEKILLGTEMSSEMGYTPSFDLVRGWDMALSVKGRVYYLNPYLEKRYENYLVVSAIAPPNTFMWDIASFSNFRELEKYDSNETVAIELLMNGEILILKDSSITTLREDGLVGIIREPVYGIGCISRSSVVNINGLVFWCDKEEIFLLNIGSSLVPQALLKNTIRDLYLAIENKDKIFGTRNRFNTYKIRLNDSTQKTEYLLSENGWIEERKWHFPEIYRGGFSNKLYFLSSGYIYEESVDFSLPESEYGEVTVE